MPTSPEAAAQRRRRPKDRKEQIARVSADAFSELGYHGVSMEVIATRVGVTAASLYRHHAGKYELFRSAVLGLGQQLVDSTDFADDSTDDPGQLWDRLVQALMDTALRNRTSGGLYRWEGRYLDRDDQLMLNAQIKLVNRRLQLPIIALRPQLDSRHRWILSSAVLSVIGSITDHRQQLSPDRIHATFTRISCDIRDLDLPAEVAPARRRRKPPLGVNLGEYEQILQSAMVLFDERGYRDTSMEEIAAAADTSTTGIYRFFPGKAAILGALYRRLADRVSGDVSTVLTTTDNATDAVIRLVDTYVRRSIAEPELGRVYFAERINVPAAEQPALRNIQRAIIGSWSRQVSAVRPEMTGEEACFAVRAAFAVAVDLSRLVEYAHPESAVAILRHVMLAALLGAPAGPRRTTSPRTPGWRNRLSILDQNAR